MNFGAFLSRKIVPRYMEDEVVWENVFIIQLLLIIYQLITTLM